MLLRIEVFPQAGKDGSAESANPKPSQTLYASPATGANRRKLLDGDKGSGNGGGDDNDNDADDATADENNNENDPNAGLVATIGRKGNVDILFGADRSISRQHALLRFVAAPRSVGPKQKGTRRTTTRGKKADSGDDSNENEKSTAAVPRGCFMEPRNEDERSACDDNDNDNDNDSNPYGMCLVLENKGKSGSYIASVDESIKDAEDGDGDDNDNEKKDDANDSDATTDDEGAAAATNNNNGGNPYPSSSQHNSMYGTATSLATQTGEIILSRKTLSPSQTLPSLSGAIRHHFGTHTPVKLTTIGADESQVLEFFGEEYSSRGDEHGDDDDNTTASSANPSILIQFGCSLLPTIKITLLPMTVVFSSGVPLSIQNSLRLCGGLLQEAGTLPRRESHGNSNSNSNNSRTTTHLVAPERMAVAKQLIAWCYGVPIVSPDFLLALQHHSALKDPFPRPTDFPAKATDTNAFWEWTPDPHLLSGYTMISVDPSPEVEQAEGLATAAGAKLERLYDTQKKHTKAKVKSFVKHAKGLLEEVIDERTTTTPTKQQQVVLLSSKVKSKWSNANTTLLLKQLKEELLIPSASSKILAKTITKQQSELVGLESTTSSSNNNSSNSNSSNSNSSNSSSSSSSNKGRSKDKKIDPPITKETVLADTDPSPTEKLDTDGNDDSLQSPELQPQKKERPNLKRERKEASAEGPMNMKMEIESQKTNSGDDHCHHDNEGNNNEVEEIPSQLQSQLQSQSQSQSQSSKRRKVNHQEQQQQAEYNPPSDDIEPVESISSSSNRKPYSTNTRKTNNSNGRTEFEFGRGDANGWFQAAPKDDRERSRLRQRASEAYQKETGIELESSASTNSGDPQIYIVTPTNGGATNDHADAVVNNHRHRRQNNIPNNLPNFKRFRKNLVPRSDASEEVVVLLDAALSQASQAPQEPNAEERQLQEHQKLAEALFKGDMVPGMVKKMRRVRK